MIFHILGLAYGFFPKVLDFWFAVEAFKIHRRIWIFLFVLILLHYAFKHLINKQ
jgi:hypothetical protein